MKRVNSLLFFYPSTLTLRVSVGFITLHQSYSLIPAIGDMDTARRLPHGDGLAACVRVPVEIPAGLRLVSTALEPVGTHQRPYHPRCNHLLRRAPVSACSAHHLDSNGLTAQHSWAHESSITYLVSISCMESGASTPACIHRSVHHQHCPRQAEAPGLARLTCTGARTKGIVMITGLHPMVTWTNPASRIPTGWSEGRTFLKSALTCHIWAQRTAAEVCVSRYSHLKREVTTYE